MGKRRFVGFKVCHALIARVLFASHSLLSIFQLYRDTNNLYFLAIVLVPACLFIEAAITILSRHGDEYKWYWNAYQFDLLSTIVCFLNTFRFCPSIFIFLCGSVPPIWLLEVGETNRALSQANYSFIQSLEEVLHSGIDESQPIEFAGLKVSLILC